MWAVDGVVGGGWDGENFFLAAFKGKSLLCVFGRRDGGKVWEVSRAVVMFQKKVIYEVPIPLDVNCMTTTFC